MEDILGKYPKLDAFIPTGGFPQFIPQAYAKVAEKYKARIADGSLALVVADTLPVQIDLMKAGLSQGPGRPAAVRDGLQDHVLPEGHQGRQGGAEGPDLYRPRRLHAARPPPPASAARGPDRSHPPSLFGGPGPVRGLFRFKTSVAIRAGRACVHSFTSTGAFRCDTPVRRVPSSVVRRQKPASPRRA